MVCCNCLTHFSPIQATEAEPSLESFLTFPLCRDELEDQGQKKRAEDHDSWDLLLKVILR